MPWSLVRIQDAPPIYIYPDSNRGVREGDVCVPVLKFVMLPS